jgi:nonsense-mediated mRNA decay protein 3
MSSFISCCLCGRQIIPNDANMCADCLRGEVDITAGIERHEEVTQCSECFKWLLRSDGSSKTRLSNEVWAHHELESPGLLSFCLKKIHGLSAKNLKVIDAGWIWTEPHSRRLQISIVLESEVLDGKTSVRQKVVVEFVVKTRKCCDCCREASDHTWGALVQVRQRTAGAKSLHALEEALIKAGLSSLMSSIEMTREVLTFYLLTILKYN